ncbi:DUF397 domain-containing protein [Streptomyces sp. NPDC048441]|uniref:DUF397 domain-containing protein n=1 Tax=Streptomyces sp. NPDC048441 TaxID=3365552 RepID=UPI003721B48A
MTLKPTAGDASELEWFKSSYSSSDDVNDCVEVAWRKSSYSSSNEPGDCVEIATTPGTIHVRDSKNTRGPQLAFPTTAWANFVTYASEL